MEKTIQITNEPIDLWSLTEPLPNFPDEYEIWQASLYTIYETLGNEFSGSIVGYVEPEENKDYSFENTSGRYKLKAYTPKGEFIQDLSTIADRIVQWAGFHKLPFIGYVYKDKRSECSLPEGTIWMIIPKNKEQLLSAVAAFYKRRKKKEEAPNIIGLSDFLTKSTPISNITDYTSFVPMRKRVIEGKTKPTATKKKIAEYRNTNPELTDEVIVQAIKDKYEDIFIDNQAVAEEGIKECYRNEQALTIENILQQIEYLVEDRDLLKYMTALQHIYSPEAKRIREKAEKIVEIIYKTACERVCNLSEFADEEVMNYFQNELYNHRENMTLSKKLNNLCCNYHCRIYHLISCYDSNNFPSFKCFDYRYGKDVTFAPDFESAKAYNEMIRKEKQTTNETSSNTEGAISNKKKGCLLWFILIPTSIIGLLFSII